MEKSFEPQTFETKWYAHWEATGCFKPSGKGQPYTIMLPPPNVTGTLHMGHAFQHTLMDALVRYHRMRGFDTLWQMGTDHAGIATEMVVSRNLAQEGKGETRDSLGRDGFIAKVWEWKAQSGDTIERQMRRMGTSGDWSRSTFTMDEQASAAVIEAFVRLHEQGLIYRGQRLVNWDPVLKTAISDLEVENVEEDGFLWSIEYPLADGSGTLVVATTRPETMLGDSAVMVHPEDERYAHLIGKTVEFSTINKLLNSRSNRRTARLIRQFGDNDSHLTAHAVFDSNFCAHLDAAPTSFVGLIDATATQDQTTSRKVWTFDELHQVSNRSLGVIN